MNPNNRSGIYCLVNILNGKFYIGSSKNLSNRLRNYLNTNYLLHKKNKNMRYTSHCKSIIKIWPK